ncbi:MAG: hypothetical protein F6K11_36120 [Leptolyngbya sp. SIO3F4]|nr:hypothetical protein [Leptolyngbya sp. SIO3F4]
MTSVFIAKMEQLLALYARPYDPRYPVVCFDERPCFLIGEVMTPLSVKPGQVAKEHYAYKKKGLVHYSRQLNPSPVTDWLRYMRDAPSENTLCFFKP